MAAEGVPVVASAVGEVAPRGGVAVCSGEDERCACRASGDGLGASARA